MSILSKGTIGLTNDHAVLDSIIASIDKDKEEQYRGGRQKPL